MLIGLVLIIPTVLSSGEYRMIKPIPVPGSVLGNKGIDSKIMQSLSQDEQQIIYDIQHPSCIKSLYGFNNQIISREHKEELKNMPSEITKGLNIRVKKVTGSCLMDEEGVTCGKVKQGFCDIYANKVLIPTSITSATVGIVYFFKMLCCSSPYICGWAACALPIMVVPPVVGAGCAEIGIGVYHRCCAHDEIMEFDDNSQSDSESKEEND